MSNSSKRKEAALRNLERMGFSMVGAVYHRTGTTDCSCFGRNVLLALSILTLGVILSLCRVFVFHFRQDVNIAYVAFAIEQKVAKFGVEFLPA